MDAEGRKRAALDFLHAAAAGTPRTAGLFAPGARHHNPHFPAGMDALVGAMEQAAKDQPGTRYVAHRALADGDLVAVHGEVQRPGEPGIAAVHIFRFQGPQVVEFWDVAAVLPDPLPNADGAF